MAHHVHNGKTSVMERTNFSTGTSYATIGGYSRAVRVDYHVYVSGTAPIMPHDAEPPPDASGGVIEHIEQNLAEAGASLHDVVRTRIYLVDPADIEGVGRAHGEAFAAAPPVTTGVVVARLFDPRWLVEIEAEAVILTT